MIRSTSLEFQYPSGGAFTFPDISLDENESLLVAGPSGSGKTTLLKLIAGFLPVEQGSLMVCGHEMKGRSVRDRDEIRRMHLGVISQRPRAIEALTVLENLRMIATLTRVKVLDSDHVASLKVLGIQEHVNSKPHMLSVGELQRLAIAMATVHKPDIILADEPTSSLDDKNTESVTDLLKEHVALNGGALLVISHDSRLMQHFSDQVRL